MRFGEPLTHTPDTEEIFEAWARDRIQFLTKLQIEDQFNRWLAEARANALRDAAHLIRKNPDLPGGNFCQWLEYRADREEEAWSQ